MKLTMDGRELSFKEGETLLDVASANGIYIPTLCWHPKTGPASRCRVCVVEVEGMRGLQTSCSVAAREGMIVKTDTPEVKTARRMTVQNILFSGHHNCMACEANGRCELQNVAYRLGLREYPIVAEPKEAMDTSSDFIVMNPNKCIVCGRCVAACNDVVVNEVLTFANRGYKTKVVCDTAVPMAESTCVQCGECLQLCPTAAITEKKSMGMGREWELEKVNTTCPYCGVGCQMTLYVDKAKNRIARVKGREGIAPNDGMLCVKGRFAYDFPSSDKRLTKPLIKKNGEQVEVSWEAALDYTANRLREIKEKHGPDAYAAIACARSTNENAYAMQKFARAVMGTNSIDHCART
jgi:predicted molibdopterin-dependent oxidoreductase YjgC